MSKTLAFLIAASLSSLACAQSSQIGRSLHTFTCGGAGCHTGTPPSISNSAQKAANNPSVIRNAIRSDKGGMGYLSYMSDTDLADIAAYIATTSPLPTLSDADRLLNWAEWKFQSLLQPRASSQVISPYTLRAYPSIYIGIANGRVLTAPNTATPTIQDLGATSTFLGQAAQDGF